MRLHQSKEHPASTHLRRHRCLCCKFGLLRFQLLLLCDFLLLGYVKDLGVGARGEEVYGGFRG